jgi:hypothetical protein
MPIVLANEDGSYTEPIKRSRARLVVLSDDMDADEISRLITLAPDQSAMRGDQMRGPRTYPHNTWHVESQLPESADPEDHLDELLNRLEPAADSIAALIADPRIHSVRMWLWLHIDNANPGISLSPALTDRVARLGTGIEIDIYVDLDDVESG